MRSCIGWSMSTWIVPLDNPLQRRLKMKTERRFINVTFAMALIFGVGLIVKQGTASAHCD
jgi:hypothetical protein